MADFTHWAQLEGVATSFEALVCSEKAAPEALLEAFFAYMREGCVSDSALEPWLSPDVVFRCEGAAAGLPFAGIERGLAGAKNYLRRLRATMLVAPDPNCPIETNARADYVTLGGRLSIRCDAQPQPLSLEFESHFWLDAELRVSSYMNLLPADHLREFLGPAIDCSPSSNG